MPKINTKTKGEFGEQLAVKFLKKKGYRIIKRNFKTKLGEIDIIGYHKKTICFIEVKARSNTQFGLPQEAVTKTKQRQIIRTAKYYIKRKRLGDHVPLRFDVLAIFLNAFFDFFNASGGCSLDILMPMISFSEYPKISNAL